MTRENEGDRAQPNPAQRRGGLMALNLALLGLLGAVTLAPDAGAQLGNEFASKRVRGQYALVGGETLGNASSTIYVLDSANRELVALRWNDSLKTLEGIGYRDLVRDANSDPDR